MIDQLETLDADGNPPETRIKDARSAQEIWNELLRADALSAFDRARIDAAYNNEPPLSQSQLNATGQAYRCNVSWGFAAMVLNMAMSGFVDVINSTEVLFECPTNYGPEQTRLEREQIIAEEVTECIRSWRDFDTVYQQLVNTFIKHGVSFGIFNDAYDWRWAASGMSDFKIPRQCKVGQDNIDLGCFLRFYSPTQLYQLIRDPEQAKDLGYNIEAIKQAIMKSVQNNNTFARYRAYDWERLEIVLRNNDYWWSYGNTATQSIRVVHIYWQEYDGRVSYGMFCDDDTAGERDWLYLKHNEFPKTTNAFVLFPYGVGTNEYIHGIRGQGYDVYPIHQALNRLYNQALELAAYGSGPILQPNNESAMQEMQFVPMGPYNLLTPGITVQPSAIVPNLSTGILPIANALTQMFRERTANANTQALLDSRTEKTATQVEAELGSIAKMSISSLNLFYAPWETLFREKVRRMKRRDYAENEPGGAFIVELHRRLLKRGGTELLESFFELETDRLRIKKAIGSGSEAARMLAKKSMLELMPYLDEYGQMNVVRTLGAEYVGYRNIGDFIQRPDAEKRPPLEASIAELQNDALLSGQIATVRPNDNHMVHARVHMEALMPVTQQADQALSLAAEQGQDVQQLAGIMQGLQALNAHTTEHVQRIAVNPIGQKIAAQYKKALQQTNEIIHNGLLQIQKIQEQQMAEAQRQGQEGQPQIDPKVLADIENKRLITEAQIQAIHIKANADAQVKQIQAAQDRAINDAMSAQKIRQSALESRVTRTKKEKKE